MADLLATLAIVLVAAVALLALAVATTVVPVFVTVQVAERRGFDLTRWGLLSGGIALLGLLVTALIVTEAWTVPRWTAALPLLLTWGGPALVSQIAEGDHSLGGRRGAHS